MNKWLGLSIIFMGSFLLALVSGLSFLSVRSSLAADSPVDVAVTLSPVISITTDATDNTLNIPITPTATGTIGTTDLTVSIHTNNPTGYTLTMSSSTNDTSLTHTTDSTHTIPTTTATLASPAILSTNTWGYSKWTTGQSTTPTTFSIIPALSSPENITTTTDLTEDPDTKLTFAANASSTLASGTYTNTIVFTATTNYVPEPIQDMQGFTATKCSALDAGETVQLRDARDGKVYRVRKMADSRCWMIDNLAYDINTAPAAGKPAYSPTAQLVSGYMAELNTRAQYAANPSYSISNNGSPTSSYLYNWCAAMGDTSADCATTVGYAGGQPAAPQTGICPAPFRLPIGGAAPTTPGNGTNQAVAAATTTNEFAKLAIWLGGTGEISGSANIYDRFTTDNAGSPQFSWSGVLSGVYAGYMGNLGTFGYWWSSTADFQAFAYALIVHLTDHYVNPIQNSTSKTSGLAVRCIL